MTNPLRRTGVAIATSALALALAACGGGAPSAADHGMTAEERAAWLAEQADGGEAAAGDEHAGHSTDPTDPTDPTDSTGGHAAHQGAPGEIQLWAVQSSLFDKVVTEGGGRILYRYDLDSAQPPASTCVDPACTATWEPLLLGEGGVVGLGVKQSTIGAVLRPDGTQQLTLAGWPLYMRAGENAGQVTTASGADGLWFAIAPDGSKATPPGTP